MNESKPIEEKLDEVDHLLIILRVVNRETISEKIKRELKTLIVKQINEILK